MEKAYLITQNTDLKQDFSEYERLYIWDQYCEHNMFYFFDDEIFINYIIKLNKKITLTTPIISENWILKFFVFLDNFISRLWENKNHIEVVVNEQWIFHKILNDYPDIQIIWGNFLSWQNKDPYLKVFVDKNKHMNISIDSEYYKKLFASKNIKNIELYNVYQWIEINNNFNINLYYPYVIYSINRYCITALIDQNINYMTVVEKCNWCKWIEKDDFNMNLKVWEENIIQYFRWNKQFYKNEKIIENKNIKRIIYNYDLLKNDR